MLYTFRLSCPLKGPLPTHSQFILFFQENVHKNGKPCNAHYHGLIESPLTLNKLRHQQKKMFDFFFNIKLKGNEMYQLKQCNPADIDKIYRYFYKGLLQNPIESIHITPENISIYQISPHTDPEKRDFCTRYWAEYSSIKKKINFKSNKSKMITYVKEQLENQEYTHFPNGGDFYHDYEMIVSAATLEYYRINELTLNKFQFVSNVQTICLLLQDIFTDNDYGETKISQWFPKIQQ